MTFRDMHHTHKLLFTGAIFLLVAVELRDIGFDRSENARLQAEARALENDRFARLLKTQQDAFGAVLKQNAESLKETLKEMESLASIGKESISQTTGGHHIHTSRRIGYQTVGTRVCRYF